MNETKLTKDLIKVFLDHQRPNVKNNTIDLYDRVQLTKLLLAQVIEEEKELMGDNYKGQYDELYHSLFDLENKYDEDLEDMKALFASQMIPSHVVNHDTINLWRNHTYVDGTPIQVGDQVLSAIVVSNSNEKLNNNMFISAIFLNESHFKLFKPYHDKSRRSTLEIPWIVQK